MHISDAKVDLYGDVVADGTIKFPPSKDEIFLQSDAKNLVIHFEDDSCWIQGAHADRDELTGYLCTNVLGPRIFLPLEFSHFLQQSLRYSRSTPTNASVNNHRGFLRVGDPAAKCWDQGLSDWHIEIIPKQGNLHVNISATLYDDKPLDAKWLRKLPPPQYWSDQLGENKKIQLEFEVDLITRALMCGALEPEISSSNLVGVKFPPTNGETIKLKNTMMTSLGHLICVDEESSFFEVSDVKNSRIVIRQLSDPECNEIGLFNYGSDSGPRVSLTCCTLKQICYTLTSSNFYSIKLENGDFGKLAPVCADSADYDSNERPDRRIRKAELNFGLNEFGLRFEYNLYCPSHNPTGSNPGWYKNTIIVSWENLLIRFPDLGRKWRKFKEA